MKAIDEKGRVFGKLNLIDLVVVLILIALVVGVAWKLLGGKISNAVAANNAVSVQYEVLCTNVDRAVADYCLENAEGQLMSNGDLLNGYVTGCTAEPYMESTVNSEGSTVSYQVTDRQNLRFTVECQVVPSNNAYEVGSQEVRVGKSHIVKTSMIEVTGTVTAMNVASGQPEQGGADAQTPNQEGENG
ncbi:MAG: DUF4330 domain-containing protein [Clostridiales bacterium]|nr:DUF4330 domain-containing protein [Clostridiales bacterium]